MTLNYWILLAAVVFTLLLFLLANHFSGFSFTSSPCTATAAALVACSWLAMLAVYGTRGLPFQWNLIITDLGGILLLAAAAILIRGNGRFSGFDTALLIPVIGLFCWDYFLGQYVAGPGKTLWSVICLAPSLLLAQGAMLLLGWAFIARWGVYGLPLFGICLLHALAQFPAYIALNLASDFKLNAADVAQFGRVLDALALLKIPLAYGVLAYLISGRRPSFDTVACLPQQGVAPDKKVFVPISVLCVGIAGDVATKLIAGSLLHGGG